MIYVRHEHCALASAMAYARKTRGRGRGDRHLRARCDPTDHRPARGRARSPAAGGVRRGSAAEERLVQPGDRPGAAHHGHGCCLSPLAHARAHAGRGTRRLPAGAARTPAGGDRRAVRSAEPAVGRSGGSAAGPRANCCRGLRRCRRIPTMWRAPRNCLPAPSGLSCSPAWVRSRPERAPLAGRWPPRRAGCSRRRFLRAGCSTTILFASASRAASRPRSASNTWRRPTSSSRSAARSPTTRAAAASSGRRRRCCRSISTPSRSARARKWRVITCEPTRAWASRR